MVPARRSLRPPAADPSHALLEPRRGGIVTLLLQPEREMGKCCLVMRIEIERLAIELDRAPSIACGIANQAEEHKRVGGRAGVVEVALAKRRAASTRCPASAICSISGRPILSGRGTGAGFAASRDKRGLASR